MRSLDPAIHHPEQCRLQGPQSSRDTCGLVELAGEAVGAAFVGAIAVCLAVTEAVRELHGANGLDVVAVQP